MEDFCISHSKDVDGIGSAALVLAAKGGGFRLTSYENLLHELDTVPLAVKRLTLCDLGTNESQLQAFVERLAALARRCEVTYIDHHFIEPTAKVRLVKAGVRLVHNTAECASSLTYGTYHSELPEGADYIALYGAVTDYADGSRISRPLMEKHDRQFVLLEATLLSYAVARNGGETRYGDRLVRELAMMKQPHEIAGVATAALLQLEDTMKAVKLVERIGTKMKRLAYAITTQHATGNVAKLLIGAFDVPVGVAYKEEPAGGWCEVSFRGTSECKVHLGRTIGRLARKYGGTGGGHRVAAGCRIQSTKIGSILAELDKLA